MARSGAQPPAVLPVSGVNASAGVPGECFARAPVESRIGIGDTHGVGPKRMRPRAQAAAVPTMKGWVRES